MRRLLLISSSRTHGTGFLEHCRDAIAEHLNGVSRVLFVPYAIADRDHYAEVAGGSFKKIGIQLDSIHHVDDPVTAIRDAESIFVGGGNSFRLLKTLYDFSLLEPIRESVRRGIPYMGSSAGTNLTCPTIRTTNDMPIVEPSSLNALGLIPFQINPHFIDADTSTTHQGETREQRLSEYLEENVAPVLGIREGSWLVVRDDLCQIQGHNGAVLFQRGQLPQEVPSGDELNFLMSEPGKA